MLEILPYVGVLLLSVVVPVGIFLGRSNIRASRFEIVNDLEKLFGFARESGGDPLIIPSFELVKYKYKPSSQRAPDDYDAHSARFYAVPVSIYIILSALGFITAFGDLKLLSKGIRINALLLGNPAGNLDANFVPMMVVLSYTFIGGYMWTIQYLIRRISNFDLSPLSFLRSAVHILFGLFVIATLYGSGLLAELGTSYFIALAFLVGFYPTLFLGAMIAKFSWINLKRVSPFSKELQEEIPLDTILGIDAFMKFRLSEFEIEDVQNLATINPIQIFVETPYGFYQVIDWVAQAQLILAVGAQKAGRLRGMCIRTIFDLEKALDNPQVKSAVLNILGAEAVQRSDIAPKCGRTGAEGATLGPQRRVNPTPQHIAGSSEVPLDPSDYCEALVSIIRDDLHVKRLRQIWDVIAGRVDERPKVRSSASSPGPV